MITAGVTMYLECLKNNRKIVRYDRSMSISTGQIVLQIHTNFKNSALNITKHKDIIQYFEVSLLKYLTLSLLLSKKNVSGRNRKIGQATLQESVICIKDRTICTCIPRVNSANDFVRYEKNSHYIALSEFLIDTHRKCSGNTKFYYIYFRCDIEK